MSYNFEHYTNTACYAYFSQIVGENRIGYVLKNQQGHIIKQDSKGNFARIIGVKKENLLGLQSKDMPWGNLSLQIAKVDEKLSEYEVKESSGLFWSTKSQRWKRVLAAKYKLPVNKNKWEMHFLLADISEQDSKNHPLSQVSLKKYGDVIFNTKTQTVSFGKCTLSRTDLIILSHYLEGATRAEMADIMCLSIKAIEKRIARIKKVLLPLDESCANLIQFTRKWGLRDMLEEKRDWFDGLAVMRPIRHHQWAKPTKRF